MHNASDIVTEAASGAADANSRHGTSASLWRRIGFVVAALLAYRLGTYVPLPGIDAAALSSSGIGDSLLGSAAIGRISILALGIWPYITASIYVQVFIWAARKTPGLLDAERRRRINTATRVLTIILSLMQGYGVALGLTAVALGGDAVLVPNPGALFTISTMMTLTAGTMFLVWLADEITKRGLGDGVMLILAAGIIANIPPDVFGAFELLRSGEISVSTLVRLGALLLAATALAVFVENARAHIPVRFPGRDGQAAERWESVFLRLNPSTIYPPSLTGSILVLPVTIAVILQPELSEGWWYEVIAMLGLGQPLHITAFAILTVLLTLAFLPNMGTAQAIAGDLVRRGGEIPGIAPGAPTAAYIRGVLWRAGCLVPFYVAAICVLPDLLRGVYRLPLAVGGMGLMIVVIALSDIIRAVTPANGKATEGTASAAPMD